MKKFLSSRWAILAVKNCAQHQNKSPNRTKYSHTLVTLDRRASTDLGRVIRVDRRYVFKPKIQIWVNFWGPWNEKKVGIVYGHLEYTTAIWYSLRPFGNLVAIWFISSRFGILNLKKSGKPTRYHFYNKELWLSGAMSIKPYVFL
jgi:hypothetical protein